MDDLDPGQYWQVKSSSGVCACVGLVWLWEACDLSLLIRAFLFNKNILIKAHQQFLVLAHTPHRDCSFNGVCPNQPRGKNLFDFFHPPPHPHSCYFRFNIILIQKYQKIWNTCWFVKSSNAKWMTWGKLTSFCPERTSSRASSMTPSFKSSYRSVTIRGGTRYIRDKPAD